MKKILLLLIFISSFAYGNKENSKTEEYWNPPTPIFSQKFDWLKLNSGEWFKGEIVSMYDDELEFESDEFNTLTFDWDDVEQLRSRFDQQIRFEDGSVKKGFLIVKNNNLVVISEGTENHFPLSDLLSITSSVEERRELWTGELSIGLDLNTGNVNQLDYLITAELERRTPFTRFKADFIYNYSESTLDDEDTTVTDMSRLTSYLDWFYSSDLFFRMVDYEYYSDLQQNIKLRHTLGLSAGYHLIDNKKLQWDVTLGPSFQITSYYDTTETENQDSLVIALNTLFEYSFSSRLDFIFDYQIQFVEEESGKRNSYLKTGLEIDVNHDFDLNILFYLDRVAEPALTAKTLPLESNDYRLVVSLSYDF